MASLEEEDYEEEEGLDGLEDVEDDEYDGDDLDDTGAQANAFFAAQNRKSSVGRRTSSQSSKYAKRSFADLPGGQRQELTEAVHALLERPTAGLSPALCAKFRPKYAEWLSALHAGFSVLLHGFGSKKALMEDFASGLEKHDAPVVVLEGYSSGARVRDLLVTLLTQVLRVPQPPNGSTRALCKQVRQAFAAATPPAAAPTTGAESVVMRLFNAGRCAEIDQGALAAAHSGLGPAPPPFPAAAPTRGHSSRAAAAAAASCCRPRYTRPGRLPR